MTGTNHTDFNQLGFDALLADTDQQNRHRKLDQETAHLPSSMGEAIPFFAALLVAHDIAMKKADIPNIACLRQEARLLAQKLNDHRPGILAGSVAPGNVLMDRTAAETGEVPLWGQCGRFNLTLANVPVEIEMHGILGIASHSHWLGFAIHAVDWERPFLSETGYRSFLGVYAEPVADLSVYDFVKMILSAYLERELKGDLLEIGAQYRERAKARED